MKYKVVVFDLDGTAIPNRADGMPSEKVITSVNEAKNIVSICAATGRTISYARPVLQALKLSSPCIISGGTQIVNPQTEEVLWEKKIEIDAIKTVLSKFEDYPYKVSFSDEQDFYPVKEAKTNKSEHIIYVMDIPKEIGDEMLQLLEAVHSVKGHIVRAYNPNHVELHITHNLATKKHAIAELLDILEVSKDKVIGIGDSNNDIPLLQSVGLKVAMGNATEEVKAIADYVAPSVDDDGVADTIERFILKK